VDYRKETGNGQIHFGWAELDNPGDPPLAVINGPVRAVVGQPVTFTARNSSVAEGHRLIGFEWNFGDGATGNGIDVTHVYNSAGKFTVSLTAIDDKGLRDTTEEEIEIIATPVTPQPDQPPVAIIIAPSKARVGDVVTFDASQSVCSNPCVSFAWDFGDGSKANAIKVQHVYRRTGDYNVILTLTDNKGLQGTPALVGQQVTFDARSSDPGSSPITVYQWNFGDGSDPVETSNPVVTHNYNSPNDYTASLNVINAQGLQSNTSDGVTVLASVPPGDTPTPTTAPPVDTPTPIPPEEDTPTPIPPEEDTPTPIPPEEDTPTPIPPEEDTPTPEVEPPIAPTPTETPTEIPPDEHSGDINGDIEIE
jgi:PKD repeat protein